MTGSIPAALGNLTNLKWLHLDDNTLTGSIPAELGNLANLERLTLYDNDLGGSIPPELGNLTSLKRLRLDGNKLTGSIPAELGRLTNLGSLYLYDNDLGGSIPPALGDLTSLTQLRLYDNELTGSIPRELRNLTSLEALHLHKNQLSGPIPDLSTLTSLTQLLLYENLLTDSIPAQLGGLTSLQFLYLDQNQLSGEIPTELGSLSNLKQLYLDQNLLTGTIPTELGNLAALQVLSLSTNELTGTIPVELAELTNLVYLYLRNNQLTGEIPTELGSLSNLRRLYLNQNRLTGTIPTELGDLAALQVLSLFTNELTGEIPTELGSLSNLQWLYLDQNRLTGEIPTALGGLTNLQRLYLNQNRLTGTIPTELGNLAALQQLDLSCNRLSGTVPQEIGAITTLTQVFLFGNPQLDLVNLPTNLEIMGREVVITGTCPTTGGPSSSRDTSDDDDSADGSTRRACPPLVPLLLPVIGQTHTATAYALPLDRALLHLHASAADSVVLAVGHIAADGATRVPGAFLRDAARGHTYTVLRRAADGLIVRHWLAPTDPLTQSIPWDRVNTAHTFPAAVLAAIPLDDRHAAPNQLARVFDGTDDRVLAFDATRGQWWHVSELAIFQALGFSWADVTAADANFIPRLAPERAAPFPRIISRTTAATAYEVPGDRLVLHRHDALAPPVVIGIGQIAGDGTNMVPIGFVRDADLGQTYAVVRREADGLIVRYWLAPTDPLIYSVPWDRVNAEYTLPAAVLATLPLDDRYPQPNQLARRFDGLDDRILAYDAMRRQWWHVPDLATFHARGFAWPNVTAADPAFFTRVATGAAVPRPLPPPPLAPAPAEAEACPPPPPPLPRLIGQNRAATAYELPGDRALLHLHASAADSAVLGIGWIAADGAARVPVDFVRDAAGGHTYAVIRREADGLIARHWLAPADPLIYAVPWDRVNAQYTFPVAALTAFPLDERHPQPDQLARHVHGADDRVFAYAAAAGQWWHVPHPAFLQALEASWDDLTAADAGFATRIAADLAGPLPRIIGQNEAATAYELPGERVVLHHHDSPASSVTISVGQLAPDGTLLATGGFVRDADLGQTYAVVRRAADGLIVRRWVAAADPLVYAIPWEHVNAQYTLPLAVLATLPLDDRHPTPHQLARRFDGTDDRVWAYDAELGQWVHVPDLATFQARGYYWCDVTGADAAFFDRINQGRPYPASSAPAQPDYPSCRP